MLAPGDRVLVAVSGGPDSAGVLLALHTLRRRLAIELVAAHVHHGLRGADADADAACAAAVAARLGVPFVRRDLGARLRGARNLEARARTLRYAALRELAAAQRCTHIATGHTLDDQAETVLMRLVRGSGVAGLGAIRPRRADGIIRPLIGCRRAAVRAVVDEAGLPWRHDASNDDPRFLRTAVRRDVLPLLARLNPRIADTCAQLASAARGEARAARRWADAELRALGEDAPLPVAWLRAQPAALRALLVRRWLVRGGVPARGLAARHVGAVLALALGAHGQRLAQLPGGRGVTRRRGTLQILHRVAATAPISATEKAF